MTLSCRPTINDDLPALHALFSAIVHAGNTTAHEENWDLKAFQAYYFDDPIMVHTALTGDTPIGFQAVFERGEGLSIGSFTDQDTPIHGAGRVLFSATRDWAEKMGYRWIDAKIRADNVPGLAYYSKMGFVDFNVERGVPLKNGTPVDRIVKRLMLTPRAEL